PSVDIKVLGSSLTIRASYLVAVGLLVVVLPRLLKARARLLQPPLIFLALFLFSYLLSTLLALDLKRAAIVFLFTLFVVLVAVVFALNLRDKDISKLERALMITTWLVVLFGFYQYFGD